MIDSHNTRVMFARDRRGPIGRRVVNDKDLKRLADGFGCSA